MSFSTIGALASQGAGYTIFNGANARGLTFIGFYTGDSPISWGRKLTTGSTLDLSFSGSTGGYGADHTWSAAMLSSSIDLSLYSSCEVTFTADKSGTIVLERSATQPTVGQGIPIVTEIESKAFSTGEQTLTFSLSGAAAYLALEARITGSSSLDLKISKWRLLR